MINCTQLCRSRACWVLTTTALVYFVMFPADVKAILAPLRSVLTLNSDVSPWLYGLAAVALACWTVRNIWLQRNDAADAN